MNKDSSDCPILAQSLESLKLDELAKEACWSLKTRKVTSLNWCMVLCMASARRGPSLRVAAGCMGLINALTISAEGVRQRLINGGGALVRKALEAAIALKAGCVKGTPLGPFRRVLVQDSTTCKLPKSMERHYPGSRNQKGGSAVLRIQAIYNLVGNQFLKFSLGPYTRNDQAASGEVVPLAGKNALELLGWQIMLTNCPPERLTPEIAYRVYAARWRIEILFKSWKSGLGLEDIGRRTSKEMLDALVYASLLRVALVHAVVDSLAGAARPDPGSERAQAHGLHCDVGGPGGIDGKANENLLENLSKHCRYDKRKRDNALRKWDKLVAEMEQLS